MLLYFAIRHFFIFFYYNKKAKYPIEYSRLLENCFENLDSAISSINLLLKTLKHKLINNNLHQIHVIDSNEILNEYSYCNIFFSKKL
jgi:hypothetical protein